MSTTTTTRIPRDSSGPSQPTSCGSPRQRREAPVRLKPTAATAHAPPPTSTATVGDVSATIAATSAGAPITDTSNTIEISA